MFGVSRRVGNISVNYYVGDYNYEDQFLSFPGGPHEPTRHGNWRRITLIPIAAKVTGKIASRPTSLRRTNIFQTWLGNNRTDFYNEECFGEDNKVWRKFVHTCISYKHWKGLWQLKGRCLVEDHNGISDKFIR